MAEQQIRDSGDKSSILLWGSTNKTQCSARKELACLHKARTRNKSEAGPHGPASVVSRYTSKQSHESDVESPDAQASGLLHFSRPRRATATTVDTWPRTQ